MILENLNNAVVNISTSGDNEIIAAPGAGKYIAIDHINLLPTSAVTVTLYSGAAGTALSGPYPFDAKQTLSLDNAMQAQKGIITCGDNKAFVINLGGAVQVAGFVRYRIV